MALQLKDPLAAEWASEFRVPKSIFRRPGVRIVSLLCSRSAVILIATSFHVHESYPCVPTRDIHLLALYLFSFQRCCPKLFESLDRRWKPRMLYDIDFKSFSCGVHDEGRRGRQ